MSTHIINGFSKLSRSEKLAWLQKQLALSHQTMDLLNGHLHPDSHLQEIYGDMIENSVSNFFMPMGLAPNFLINGNLLTVPMVIEESSVVAAASHAAKFWAMHGGFHAEVVGTQKSGQVYFTWNGKEEALHKALDRNREKLMQAVKPLISSMEKRGGGIDNIEIMSVGPELPQTYQLFVTFKTANAMGANFINSVLETMAEALSSIMKGEDAAPRIIMSILSNYTPECRVNCFVEGDTAVFNETDPNMNGDEFARKFKKAVDIAIHDPYRAVTHNKGIFNGMDAVVLATGNDYRAVEACGHAYASKDGRYSCLSRVEVSERSFRLSLDVPLAVGTVGGLTGTHPMAGVALEILGHPSAEQLMQVIGAAGLATNFSAVRSLITSGIQKGHMKMHLSNILRQLKASPGEIEKATLHFMDRTISHAEVSHFLNSIRDKNHWK